MACEVELPRIVAEFLYGCRYLRPDDEKRTHAITLVVLALSVYSDWADATAERDPDPTNRQTRCSPVSASYRLIFKKAERIRPSFRPTVRIVSFSLILERNL